MLVNGRRCVAVAHPDIESKCITVSMQRIRKSKSRTSLLADLIATEDESERTSVSGGTVDITGLLLPVNWKETDPSTMLRELLGDFYVDANALEMKELLGQGGFAVVHRCLYYDPKRKTQISVAMKQLKPDLLGSVEDLREFVMEASLMKKLHHNNIVSILGIGAQDCSSMQTMRRSVFILQEYVPGKNLKEMVIEQMCNRNAHVYNALYYLHEVCRPMIVHRDLKLDNILLTQNGKMAKLCDFGLHKRIRSQSVSVSTWDGLDESYYGGMLYQSLMERVAEDTPSQDSGEHSLQKGVPSLRDLTVSTQISLSRNHARSTQSLKLQSALHGPPTIPTSCSERPSQQQRAGFTGKVGSIVYMAPEVFMNKTYNEKVDVFSFGVMMYELLAQTNIAVKYGMTEEHGALGDYAEKVAEGFRETLPEGWPDYVKMLISECWHQNPNHRPSFKDIIHRLSFIYDSGIEEKMGRPLINMNIPCSCCCIQ